jgi:hypothetical protein
VNEPPDVNVKLPLAFNDSEPLPLPSTSWAVRLSPSASVSLARTPGAATDRVTPVVAVYELFAATGAAFVTVIVTVAWLDGRINRQQS